MTIGTRIQRLRKQKGLSQNRLAQIAGISRQAVSKWENDQAAPDTMHLIVLADILDTEVEYLATGKSSSDIKGQDSQNLRVNSAKTPTKEIGSVPANMLPSPLFIILISVLSFLLGVIFSLLLIILS